MEQKPLWENLEWVGWQNANYWSERGDKEIDKAARIFLTQLGPKQISRRLQEYQHGRFRIGRTRCWKTKCLFEVQAVHQLCATVCVIAKPCESYELENVSYARWSFKVLLRPARLAGYCSLLNLRIRTSPGGRFLMLLV
jgi:hypothetical protein